MFGGLAKSKLTSNSLALNLSNLCAANSLRSYFVMELVFSHWWLGTSRRPVISDVLKIGSFRQAKSPAEPFISIMRSKQRYRNCMPQENRRGTLLSGDAYSQDDATIFSDGTNTLAEALALRFGLVRALEAGLGSMQAESDLKILIKTCKGEHTAEAYVMTLVEDIKSMGHIVQGIEFLHVRRDANKVAHTLARFGSSSVFEQVWLEEALKSVTHLF
ncbi:hypothetical protein ACS0TY_002374 [Phlomoides rotata]